MSITPQTPAPDASPSQISEQEKRESLYMLPQRRRGDHLNSFRNVTILTNHYRVTLKNINHIVIYKVVYNPRINQDNTKLRFQLFESLKGQITKKIKNPIFTGYNVLSSHFEEEDSKEHAFMTIHQGEEYSLKMTRVKVFRDIEKDPRQLLAFLNNALKNTMRKLDFVEIGRSGKYFNRTDRQPIDSNLTMYNGFKSNFVQLEKGQFFLRVDAAKKIVRNDTVLSFINKIYKINQGKSKEEKRAILKQQLINQTVMANYGKTKYHRILDVRFEQVGSIKLANDFDMVDYYKTKYNIEIKEKKQPVLEVQGQRRNSEGVRQNVLLVPELLLMTGIPQDFDEMKRKQISELTIKGPQDKIKEIGQLMKKLKYEKEFEGLRQLGLKVSSDMAEITAKSMPNPTLQLGKSNSVDKGREAFFNLFNKPIFNAERKVQLGLICPKGMDISFLLKTFESTAKNLDVKLKTNEYKIDSSKVSVGDIEKKLEKANNDGCNLCLIVLPGYMKNDYPKIKKIALAIEMTTQVLTQAKLKHKNAQSILTKVLLQILAKRGNTLWVSTPTCSVKDTMLVGFDTCKIGGKTILSIAAFINSTFSSIFTQRAVYLSSDDKYKSMINLYLLALDAFNKRNKKVPSNTIVFQNSCAGDQNKLFFDNFVVPFNQLAKETYKQNIHWMLISINGKSNQRFVSTGGQVQNVNAGTLIANQVVSDNYDFYIVSQKSTKGTSVPNHYKVIYSNSTLEEGVVHEICFSQCFNYVNWQGSIKVPSVLQYAKKCAKFLSDLGQVNNQVLRIPDTLENRMFYV